MRFDTLKIVQLTNTGWERQHLRVLAEHETLATVVADLERDDPGSVIEVKFVG
jgi:hypothetical protein